MKIVAFPTCLNKQAFNLFAIVTKPLLSETQPAKEVRRGTDAKTYLCDTWQRSCSCLMLKYAYLQTGSDLICMAGILEKAFAVNKEQ